MSFLLQSSLLYLFLLSSSDAHVLPRADDGIASMVSAAASSASLTIAAMPKPSQKVESLLAIGDSYTAGIGSDGEPDIINMSGECSRYRKGYPVQLQADDAWRGFNGGAKPDLVFGACSGHKMNDMVRDQLTQGEPYPNLPFTKIGKPQVAVLTISGNDLQFASALKACVYGVNIFGRNCDDQLSWMEQQLTTTDFKLELINTLIKVVFAGRKAGGANPPESFQVFIGGYVGFFNHDNPDCDNVNWGWYGAYRPLTRDLRKRMNILADNTNRLIEDVAGQMNGLGVFWAGTPNSAYDTHRFCEPGQNYKNPVASDIWFWHYKSSCWPSGCDNDLALAQSEVSFNLSEVVLNATIPDPAVRKTINADNPPWKVNPTAFQSEDALTQTLERAGNETGQDILPEYLKRIFHPKGTALKEYSNMFLRAIRDNRQSLDADAAPYTTGNCTLHMSERKGCTKDDSNLSATMLLKDAKGVRIGQTDGYQPINAAAPYGLKSKLPNVLVVTGQNNGGYVQYSYGGESWKSSNTWKDNDKMFCSAGGWDPKEGPQCLLGEGVPSTRQIDCWFQC